MSYTDKPLYNLGGTKGTVLVFHGHNRDGSVTGWTRIRDQVSFLDGLKQAGFSYIVPPSGQGKWNDSNRASNPDVVHVDKLITSLGAKAPFFYVGLSNGGGFAPRMALLSQHKPKAVQFSNSPGGVRRSSYVVPSMFCFSRHDPIVEYSKVRNSMSILIERDVPVVSLDLTQEYREAGSAYDNDHQFMDVSYFTVAQFARFSEM